MQRVIKLSNYYGIDDKFIRNRDATNYEQDNDWEDYDDDLDEYPSRSVMRRVEIMKNRKEN